MTKYQYRVIEDAELGQIFGIGWSAGLAEEQRCLWQERGREVKIQMREVGEWEDLD